MLENTELAQMWFKRAVSSFRKAILAANHSEVFYEDVCFDLQQSVEKALKSLLIYKNIDFPKTHSLNVLTSLLVQNGVELNEDIIESVGLTMYAVQTRYPGEYDEISKEDFEYASQLAIKVLIFVEEKQGFSGIFKGNIS